MNIILLAAYISLSTGGATLVKLGGTEKWRPLFSVPGIGFDVSLVTLFGAAAYGLSFLVFIVLLNKLDLSYLTPVATGLSYAILMGVSVIVFHENFTLPKTLGCILILVGILLVMAHSPKIA